MLTRTPDHAFRSGALVISGTRVDGLTAENRFERLRRVASVGMGVRRFVCHMAMSVARDVHAGVHLNFWTARYVARASRLWTALRRRQHGQDAHATTDFGRAVQKLRCAPPAGCRVPAVGRRTGSESNSAAAHICPPRWACAHPACVGNQKHQLRTNLSIVS
jgi:hypothetical protein